MLVFCPWQRSYFSGMLLSGLLVLFLSVALGFNKAQARLVKDLGGPSGYGELVSGPIDVSSAFPDGLSMVNITDTLLVAQDNGVLTLGVSEDPLTYAPGALRREDVTVAFFAPYHAPVAEAPTSEYEHAIYFSVQRIENDTQGQVVVTWSEMVTDERRDEAVTYQVVIRGRAGNQFDVDYRYERCDWTYGRHDGGPTLDYAQIGLGGPGLYFFEWPGSGTADVDALCVLKNVPGNNPGEWFYRVQSTISGCGDGVIQNSSPHFESCDDGADPVAFLTVADGCSPDCRVEPDEDGDRRHEPPPGNVNADPDRDYDQCVDPNVCFDDIDQDGFPDNRDNCPTIPNQSQLDTDADGAGQECDVCVSLYDPSQVDLDSDGVGDVCDNDDDDDGVSDCGVDEVCFYGDDAIDNDFDGRTDESGECEVGQAQCSAARDGRNNDGDLFTDEVDEDGVPLPPWTARDPNGSEDNCRGVWNPGQEDFDSDGFGDACDDDRDGDGALDCGRDGFCPIEQDGKDNDRDAVVDEAGECGGLGCPTETDLLDSDGDGRIDEGDERGLAPFVYPGPDGDESQDNCLGLPNPEQSDFNRNLVGDACDDSDGDGYTDSEDLCPALASENQDDLDEDLVGDPCDADTDGDFVLNEMDNCPRLSNASQLDLDSDGLGDDCDDDDDNDGASDGVDNCPNLMNPDQLDDDGDGIGNLCDDDDDGDGVSDAEDNCEGVESADSGDTDGDGLGDACDPDDDNDGIPDIDDLCPKVDNPEQGDLDEDGEGDACDADDDGDRVNDEDDNCPRSENARQEDIDSDGVGDVCDEDDDGDGISDEADICPLRRDPEQKDLDRDGVGDACDDDDDGDELVDWEDNCPAVSNPRQVDDDGDGQGNACEPFLSFFEEALGEGTGAGCSASPAEPTTHWVWVSFALACIALRRRRT